MAEAIAEKLAHLSELRVVRGSTFFFLVISFCCCSANEVLKSRHLIRLPKLGCFQLSTVKNICDCTQYAIIASTK